jgi:hypothetical protein
MKKLKLQSDQLTILALNGNWMAQADVARMLGCRRDQAYDKVLKIANKHRLFSMSVETGGDAQIILYSNKSQLLELISRLPRNVFR